jgi:hypothetical protein
VVPVPHLLALHVAVLTIPLRPLPLLALVLPLALPLALLLELLGVGLNLLPGARAGGVGAGIVLVVALDAKAGRSESEAGNIATMPNVELQKLQDLRDRENRKLGKITYEHEDAGQVRAVPSCHEYSSSLPLFE